MGMGILLTGMVIFFGTHLSPGVFGLRNRLVNRLGEGRFQGLYIAASVTGMLCIIAGKSLAPFVTVYHPAPGPLLLVPVLMAAAFIMFAAFAIPSNFKRFTRHPMLWGITLWSVAHLLANGDLASVLVFGGFGSYAIVSMWSLNKRGAQKSTQRYAPLNDVAVVAAGLGGCALVAWLHPLLFGVPAFVIIS